MRQAPTLEARDNLAIMGLLEEPGEAGTPLTDERREDAIQAFAAILTLLYPAAAAPPEEVSEPPQQYASPGDVPGGTEPGGSLTSPAAAPLNEEEQG